MNHTPNYPLSRTQQEIMKFELQYPGSNINNLSAVCELPNGIDEAKLLVVLNMLICQEQALRMQMFYHNGEIRQYERVLPLTIYTKTIASNENLMEVCEQQGQEPFFLWDNPLYRFTLLRTDTNHMLLYTLHHVIADGWSMAQLAAHVQASCERILNGESSDETQHFCTSFLKKERLQLQNGRFDADGAYWREQFANFDTRARVKAGKEFSNSENGQRISFVFTPEEVLSLNRHCSECRISPAIPVLTAIILYLKKQNPMFPRIDIGEMILNRRGTAEMQTIGNFAAEVLLCVPITAKDTIQMVEQNVRKATLAAYHHSSFLHDDVLELVKERLPETVFLRDVEFGYLPPVFMDGSRLNASWVENCALETAVEINLFQMCQKDELSLIMDYRTDVLTPEEAEQMLNLVHNYLNRVLDNTVIQVDALLEDIHPAPATVLFP